MSAIAMQASELCINAIASPPMRVIVHIAGQLRHCSSEAPSGASNITLSSSMSAVKGSAEIEVNRSALNTLKSKQSTGFNVIIQRL